MTVQIQIDLRASLVQVRDQGNRPTCLAHAATLAHEHARSSLIRLSPEYLHYFATGYVSSNAASMSDMSMALRRNGQSSEADCPYLDQGPPSGWTPPDPVPLFRRESLIQLAAGTSVKDAIVAGHVPVLGMTLPDTFYSPQSPFIIPARGRLRALHAVAAVGIGTTVAGDLILIRNSWGAAWGDQGHAWLDETFLGTHLREILLLTTEVV